MGYKCLTVAHGDETSLRVEDTPDKMWCEIIPHDGNAVQLKPKEARKLRDAINTWLENNDPEHR